jgi:hypothetical protein
MQENYMSITITKVLILKCNFCGAAREDIDEPGWLTLTELTKKKGKKKSDHACPDCNARIERLKEKEKEKEKSKSKAA